MPPLRATRVAAVAVPLAAVALTALTGCAPTVALDPAENANDADCARVTVALPDTVGDLVKRQTNAQATGAWGDPTAVILYCGVPVPGPSPTPCFERDGLFWLREDLDDRWAFTTYGRDPAVRVLVAKDAFSSPGIAIDDLTLAVSTLPENGRACLDLDDTVTGQDVTGQDGPGQDGPG